MPDDYELKATVKVDADTSEAEKKLKELPKLFEYLFDSVYDKSKYTKFDIEEVARSFEKLNEKQQEVNRKFGSLFRRRHRVNIDSRELDQLYNKFRALRMAIEVNAKDLGLPRDVLSDLARFEMLLNKVSSGKVKNKKVVESVKSDAEALLTQLELLEKGKISPIEFQKIVKPTLRSLPLPQEYVGEQPATLLEANAGLEGLYDVLKKSKATRFQRTLDLFIASVFDAITASFDKGVATVISKSGTDVEAYMKTQHIGRMIGASMVNPQSFAEIFSKVVESNTVLSEKFLEIADKVGLKYKMNEEGRVEAVGGNIRGFVIELLKQASGKQITGGEEDKALAAGLSVGYLQSLVIGVSGLMAKVGVIGVILNKILEIFMRLMALSGSMQATVKMIGLFIQMTLKPLADLLASLFMPLVMMLMPVIVKLVRWWNDLYKVWMRNALNDKKLSAAQMASAMAGFLKGGLWGGLAGALAPMMAYYGYKEGGWEAKTIGTIGVGLETLTLTGSLKMFSVSSAVINTIKTKGNIIVKGAKTIIEWATGNKGNGTQSTTTGGGGGGSKPPVVVTNPKEVISKGKDVWKKLPIIGSLGWEAVPALYGIAAGAYSIYKNAGDVKDWSKFPEATKDTFFGFMDTNPAIWAKSTMMTFLDVLTFESIDAIHKEAEKSLEEYYSYKRNKLNTDYIIYNPLNPYTTQTVVMNPLKMPITTTNTMSVKHEVEVNVNAPDLNDPKYQEELRRIFEEMYSEQMYNAVSRG